jgi:DNA mismatch repair protein MutS
LQVASLAGVPPVVIQRAKRYLSSLEAQQVDSKQSLQGQLPLSVIEPLEKNDRLRDLLDDFDPDTMSPREALDALYELKEVDDS